jgi:hypothetical protein
MTTQPTPIVTGPTQSDVEPPDPHPDTLEASERLQAALWVAIMADRLEHAGVRRWVQGDLFSMAPPAGGDIG